VVVVDGQLVAEQHRQAEARDVGDKVHGRGCDGTGSSPGRAAVQVAVLLGDAPGVRCSRGAIA
jgi:hypothetical protein